MEVTINKQKLVITDAERALLRATASNDAVGIEHRVALAQSLSAAWKAGVLEPDTLAGIFTRVALEVGANAKFPLDFYGPAKQDQYRAVTMPKEGAIPNQVIEGDELIVPTYKITNSIGWALDYARDSRWDIIARAMEVFTNGFVQKVNRDGWHVLLACAKSNSVISDSAATAGAFTKKLLIDMQVAIKRLTGGRNSKLTDLYLSPEALGDIRDFSTTVVDDVTLRTLLFAGVDSVPSFFGVRLNELEELGVSQEYQTYLTSTLKASMAASDTEFCVGLDLQNRDSFVMPVREDMSMFDDPTLHRSAQAGVYGWMELGFAALDTRRALLGSM